jgi:hypothetical protein
MSDNNDYKVGRGRPPLHTRFKPGDRANPRGRPKGSLNVATIIKRAAREKVTVTENGRRKTKTKLEVAATQGFNQAAGGVLRAIELVFNLVERFGGETTLEAPSTDAASRQKGDAAVLKALKARLYKLEDHADGD